MYLPDKIWDQNPLKQIARASLEKPGMYLIALRAHLGRGKTMLGDMIDSVADALPQPGKLRRPDEAA
ncbi:MAG TPA: hypothetical protein VK633_12640 [Verrucomicrobiae bacterium]|nr:hypothetical protein [Verrucomicrobiae bacterium]